MSAGGSEVAAGGEPAVSRHHGRDRDSDTAGGDLRSAADLEAELGEIDPEIAACYDVPADQLDTIDPDCIDLVRRG